MQTDNVVYMYMYKRVQYADIKDEKYVYIKSSLYGQTWMFICTGTNVYIRRQTGWFACECTNVSKIKTDRVVNKCLYQLIQYADR